MADYYDNHPITCLQDLFEATCTDTKPILEKMVYKGTSCGAYIAFEDDGIVLGSIVEGVDYGTENHKLTYPFDKADFWSTLNSVDEEAKEIWDRTHGCDDCDMEDPETGEEAINPYCTTCLGHGVIL